MDIDLKYRDIYLLFIPDQLHDEPEVHMQIESMNDTHQRLVFEVHVCWISTFHFLIVFVLLHVLVNSNHFSDDVEKS